jgi:hypothetical protein
MPVITVNRTATTTPAATKRATDAATDRRERWRGSSHHPGGL